MNLTKDDLIEILSANKKEEKKEGLRNILDSDIGRIFLLLAIGLGGYWFTTNNSVAKETSNQIAEVSKQQVEMIAQINYALLRLQNLEDFNKEFGKKPRWTEEDASRKLLPYIDKQERQQRVIDEIKELVELNQSSYRINHKVLEERIKELEFKQR